MDPEGKRPRTVRRKAASRGDNAASRGYLDGQLLIAMPVMDDPRFERSVIYLCAHSSEGAMGIIVNRPAGSIDFPGLLVQLDIIKKADQIKLPENAEIHEGAERRSGRDRPRLRAAFQRFLHRGRDAADRRRNLPDRHRRYPQGDCQGRRAEARDPALGYAGWAAGQLENEIQHNGWLHCDADPDLVFGGDVEEKYLRALAKIGINPGMLSTDAGHA